MLHSYVGVLYDYVTLLHGYFVFHDYVDYCMVTLACNKVTLVCYIVKSMCYIVKLMCYTVT